MDKLIYDFKKIDIFNHIILDLQNSYPIYRIDPEIMVNFNKKLAKIDTYMHAIEERIEFMAASEEEDNGVASVIAVGYDLEKDETLYAEANWVLIERIADDGGSAEMIQIDSLKGFAEQICPRTAYC